MNAEERLDHCVKIHKLPKDFRFDQRPKHKKNKKNSQSMDIDDSNKGDKKEKKFCFTNSKQKGFKKFTNDQQTSTGSVDVDEIMSDIRESLPK